MLLIKSSVSYYFTAYSDKIRHFKSDPVGNDVLFISLPDQHVSVCLPMLVGIFEVRDSLSYSSGIHSNQKPIPHIELSRVRSDDI